MENTNPFDAHIGKKIRLARKLKGLTQSALAEIVGISFQQVQKYETGKNQVSAKRLFEFADILGITTSFFFDGFKSEKKYTFKDNDGITIVADSASEKSYVYSELNDELAVELLKAFNRIQNREKRRTLVELVRTFADESTDNRSRKSELTSA